MSSRHRLKSSRGSPSNNRNEMYRKINYDMEKLENEVPFKRERSFDGDEYHRSALHRKRRSEDDGNNYRRQEKSHSRSGRHQRSSKGKVYVKEEVKDVHGGKWERDEKYSDYDRIKTEPVSEGELEDEGKPAHVHVIPAIKPEKPVKKEERENWGKEEDEKPEKKEGINLGLSGKLTEDANTYNGVVITYSQPPEARKPKRRWRWYIFKDDQEIPFLPLHRQSAYLIGRNRKVADIPIDHPSCSKQHAVLQYRLVSYTRVDGSTGRTVKPYIIDLESANGTYVNTKKINPKHYMELFERDVVKFGFSTREYVLLHEGSKGSDNELVDTSPELSPVSMLKS